MKISIISGIIIEFSVKKNFCFQNNLSKMDLILDSFILDLADKAATLVT